jgi:breast cancer 2 susceptibility protein
MPECIESMFDDCEYSSDASSVLRRASKNEAGWLARFARKRVEEEREALEQGLERELQVIQYLPRSCFSPLTQRPSQSACPPREVRSFRVLLMRDACATRRPARRVAELTAWDVLTLSFDESPAGKFKEGQRFQVLSSLVANFLVLRYYGLARLLVFL